MQEQMSFGAFVAKATCDCHKEKWLVIIDVLLDGEQRTIHQEFFDDEKTANKNCDEVLKKESYKWLEKHGAKEIELLNQKNQNLH